MSIFGNFSKKASRFIKKTCPGTLIPNFIFHNIGLIKSWERFLSILIKTKPSRIVYVSCDPATLARDLKYLSSVYDIVSVNPVDMFPHTAHIENVAKLVKR